MFGSGGAKRDRTADLLHAMQALSQLSYGPDVAEERNDSGGFFFWQAIREKKCSGLQWQGMPYARRLVFPMVHGCEATHRCCMFNRRAGMSFFRCAGALLLATAMPVSLPQVFKCVEGGVISYQSAPCTRGHAAKSWVIEPSEAASVPSSRRTSGASRHVGAGSGERRVRRHASASARRPRMDACEVAKTGREAAYRKAGLKRDFRLSSHWDNRVHEACW